MTPRRVVEQFVAGVLGGGNPGATDALVTSAELRQRARGLRSAFPDLEVETVVLVAEETLVAGHFTGRGTHLGLFQGVPPTGRECVLSWTGVYRVEDGRIADAWVTLDHLSLLEQLAAVERAATVSA